MPLRKGKSKKVVSQNISELHSGKTYTATKSKFGKKKADKQAVAIAMSTARKSNKKKGKKKFNAGAFENAKNAHFHLNK